MRRRPNPRNRAVILALLAIRAAAYLRRRGIIRPSLAPALIAPRSLPLPFASLSLSRIARRRLALERARPCVARCGRGRGRTHTRGSGRGRRAARCLLLLLLLLPATRLLLLCRIPRVDQWRKERGVWDLSRRARKVGPGVSRLRAAAPCSARLRLLLSLLRPLCALLGRAGEPCSAGTGRRRRRADDVLVLLVCTRMNSQRCPSKGLCARRTHQRAAAAVGRRWPFARLDRPEEAPSSFEPSRMGRVCCHRAPD